MTVKLAWIGVSLAVLCATGGIWFDSKQLIAQAAVFTIVSLIIAVAEGW